MGKWRKSLLIGVSLLTLLAGCQYKKDMVETPQSIPTSEHDRKEVAMKTINVRIDGQEIAVFWEENPALSALRQRLENSPLHLTLSAYRGFEQVGSLGFSLPTQDRQQDATSGDIMLYNGNQLVLFFGTNHWAYTKLGSISEEQDVADLLNKERVVVELYLQE